MSSRMKPRRSRRKFHHQPTDIDGLSLLLTRGSKAYSSEVKRASRREKKASHELDGSDDEEKSRRSSVHHRRRHRHGADRSPSSKQSREKKKGSTSSLKMKTSIEDENDLNNITFRLGNITYSMDDMGEWKTSLKNSSLKEEIAQLAQSNLKTSQENNMIRVKNELLLDMIAKKNLRMERVEAELQRLRKLLSTSSCRFSLDKHKLSY